MVSVHKRQGEVNQRDAKRKTVGDLPELQVLAGSPHGGDVAVNVFVINQLMLPTLFYSVLVSVSVFMVLSTVFHPLNSPNNSRLSHSVLPILALPYWSFQLHISL